MANISVHYSNQLPLQLWNNDGQYGLVVPKQLYEEFLLPFGKLTITNPVNQRSLRIKSIVQMDSPALKNREKPHVQASKEIFEYLQLAPGDIATINVQLSETRQLKRRLSLETDNSFGKAVGSRAYVAKAAYKKSREDLNPGRPGIFLTREQRDFLLGTTLQPLCGEDRLKAAKDLGLPVLGLIQIFHKGKSIEVDVYPHQAEPLSRQFFDSSVTITNSLHAALDRPGIGDALMLCSRFDVHSIDEALAMESTVPALDTPNTFNVKEFCRRYPYRHYFSMIPIEKRMIAPILLEGMTQQAQTLLDNPSQLATAFDLLDYLGVTEQRPLEYKRMITALKQCTFDTEDVLIKSASNIPLLRAFIKEGFLLKDQSGDNFLHHVFLRPNASETNKVIAGLSSLGALLTPLMRESNESGNTPLHHLMPQLCLTLKHENVSNGIKLMECLAHVHPRTFVNPKSGVTPFHHLFDIHRLSSFPSVHIVVVKALMDVFGNEVLDWFDQEALIHKKPLDTLLNSPQSLKKLIDQLKESPDEKSKRILAKLDGIYNHRIEYNTFRHSHFIHIPKEHFPIELKQALFEAVVMDLPNQYWLAIAFEKTKKPSVRDQFKKWAKEHDCFASCDRLLKGVLKAIDTHESTRSEYELSTEIPTMNSYLEEGIISLEQIIDYWKNKTEERGSFGVNIPLFRQLSPQQLIDVLSFRPKNNWGTALQDSSFVSSLEPLFHYLDAETILKISLITFACGKRFAEMGSYFCHITPHLKKLKPAQLIEILSSIDPSAFHRIFASIAPQLSKFTADELISILVPEKGTLNWAAAYYHEINPHLLPALLRLPLKTLSSFVNTLSPFAIECGYATFIPLLKHLGQQPQHLLSYLFVEKEGQFPHLLILANKSLRTPFEKIAENDIQDFLSSRPEIKFSEYASCFDWLH